MLKTKFVAWATAAAMVLIGAAAPAVQAKDLVLHTDTVGAFSTDRYVMTFPGGQEAVVAVVGDGSTALDLYVYDEDGRLIVCNEGPSDRGAVRWTPPWTGKYLIKVKNRGGVPNTYLLGTK